MAPPGFVELSNGVRMPSLGLGTGGTPGLQGPQCRELVLQALALGYRCIDTAELYHNQREVGEALRVSGVPRSEVFVISKLAPMSQGMERAKAAVSRMLEELGLECLDLVLVHWPGAWAPNQRQWSLRDWECCPAWAKAQRLGTWRALEQLYDEGRVRAIGVSNYTVAQLEELALVGSMLPHVMQSELHPYFANADVRRWCASHRVAFSAYAPLGGYVTERNNGRRALDDPVVLRVAEACGHTPAQVVLSWALARNASPVPKTCKAERLEENLGALDCVLEDAQLREIDALDRGQPLYWDPRCVDKLDHFNPFLDRARLLAELDAKAKASRGTK